MTTTTTRRRITITDRLARRELTDFVLGFPPLMRAEFRQSDREIARDTHCQYCGSEPCALLPYHHPQSGEYRPFIECPRCGHTEEI